MVQPFIHRPIQTNVTGAANDKNCHAAGTKREGAKHDDASTQARRICMFDLILECSCEWEDSGFIFGVLVFAKKLTRDPSPSVDYSLKGR